MPKVTEAHIEARRNQILLAARKCFSRNGFHQATVREICAEAGLSPGAIYGYFESKDDIVEALAEMGRESTRALLGAARSNGDAPPALADLLAAVMRVLESPASRDGARLDLQLWGEGLHTPHLHALLLEAQANVLEPFVESVRGEQRRAGVSADLDPEAVARVCLGLGLGFTVQVAMQPELGLSRCAAVVRALFDGSFARGSDST